MIRHLPFNLFGELITEIIKRKKPYFLLRLDFLFQKNVADTFSFEQHTLLVMRNY